MENSSKRLHVNAHKLITSCSVVLFFTKTDFTLNLVSQFLGKWLTLLPPDVIFQS